MAIMRFNPERAKLVLACIDANTPIKPPGGGWNDVDALELAGIFAFVAMQKLTESRMVERVADYADDQEHGNRVAQAVFNDFTASLHVLADLASSVASGQYDAHFAGDVVADIDSVNGDGRLRIVAGLRDEAVGSTDGLRHLGGRKFELPTE